MIKINRRYLPVIFFTVMVIALGALWLWKSDNNILGANDSKVVLRFQTSAAPKVNQPYVVKMIATSPQDAINSVGIYLRFDPQKLRVMEIDTLKSFCQFYPEKKFDNNLGQISLACGAPHPGTKGEIELMSITFLPLTQSSSQVLMDGRSVLLKSDGKGTNLLKDYPLLEVAPGVDL